MEIYKIRNIALFRCAFTGLTQVSIFDPLRVGITCDNQKCKQNLGIFAQPPPALDPSSPALVHSEGVDVENLERSRFSAGEFLCPAGVSPLQRSGRRK